MHLDNLMIEVTRRCNMECDHCLRGCSQDVNIDTNDLFYFLLYSRITSIGTVTLTGGEPLLFVEKLNTCLDIIETAGVCVDNYYIVTNGSVLNDKIMLFLARLMINSDNVDEVGCISISDDEFHRTQAYSLDIDEERDSNINKIQSVFNNVNIRGNMDHRSLINQGFCEFGSHELERNTGYVDEDRIGDLEVYLNANGDVVAGCNWSYENQESNIIVRKDDYENFETKVLEYCEQV